MNFLDSLMALGALIFLSSALALCLYFRGSRVQDKRTRPQHTREQLDEAVAQRTGGDPSRPHQEMGDFPWLPEHADIRISNGEMRQLISDNLSQSSVHEDTSMKGATPEGTLLGQILELEALQNSALALAAAYPGADPRHIEIAKDYAIKTRAHLEEAVDIDWTRVSK